MYADDTYVYVGGSEGTLNIQVPFPTVGDLTFQVTENVKSELNANGVEVRQRIGEEILTQHLEWGMIESEKWWEINRFFQKNGNVFYCKFFNHNIGEWQVKRFRKNDTSCDLMLVTNEGNVECYENAGFDIVSIGE